jgi:hypothetical protein
MWLVCISHVHGSSTPGLAACQIIYLHQTVLVDESAHQHLCVLLLLGLMIRVSCTTSLSTSLAVQGSPGTTYRSWQHRPICCTPSVHSVHSLSGKRMGQSSSMLLHLLSCCQDPMVPFLGRFNILVSIGRCLGFLG